MTSCDFCRKEIDNLAFKCNYCGESYCQTHRLPEIHECAKIAQAAPPGTRPDEAEVFKKTSRQRETTGSIDLAELKERANMESQPYSVVEVEHTVGNTPEPDFDTGPDVGIDGTIKDDDSNTTKEPQPEKETASPSKQTVIILVLVILALLLMGIFFEVI